MTKKEFQRFLDRDSYCLHCGLDDDTLVPNHRASRGSGGSKTLNKPSNIVVLCSLMNNLIESDSKAAEIARKYGWKLARWQNPAEEPVFDVIRQEWLILFDDFSRGIASKA